jgi:hypothetical protein
MPRIRLSPEGAGAWNVIVLPSAEEMSFTTAEPIFTVLPVDVKPLPRTVIVLPAETRQFGYISEIETGLGFGAATVNRTGLLLTPNPSAVTEIWYVEGGIGTPQKLLAPSLFWRQSLTLM